MRKSHSGAHNLAPVHRPRITGHQTAEIIPFPSPLTPVEQAELTRSNQDAMAARHARHGRMVTAMVQQADAVPDHLLMNHIENTVLRVKHNH